MSTAVDRRVPPNLQVFKARLLFAANEVGSFWFGIVGYFLVLGIFVWGYFHNEPPFHSDGIVLLSLFALEVVGILILVTGKLLGMWPYAIGVEPEKGIWVFTPPARFWVPIDEIVDIDVYSGMYEGGHVIQLSRSHGLVKQVYLSSFFFPDQGIVNRIRSLIDSSGDGTGDTG